MAKDNIKKKRKKTQAPVALVYFITLVIVLLVIGGISMLVMTKLVLVDDSSSVSSEENSIPTKKDNATKLYLLVNDRGELEMTMVERVLPKSAKIVLLPISEKTLAEGTQKTLAEIYSSVGSQGVKMEIETLLGTEMNNYIVLNHENFENLIDNLASISYTVSEDMYYIDENSDDIVNYEQGEELTLFGSELRPLLTYPEYTNGPGENVKVCGELISSVVNQGLKTSLTVQNLSATFSTMVKNSDDKDFSLNDFTEKTQSNIQYIIDNSNEPADYITATGSWNDDGTAFTVDESFKEQLQTLFEL